MNNTALDRFTEEIEVLRELSRREEMPIMIIGGVATVYHGYERSVEDLDIVVSAPHFELILQVCGKYGFEILPPDTNGVHKLLYKNSRVDVTREGHSFDDPGRPKPMLGPAACGIFSGVGFFPLKYFVELKLFAGRDRDYVDIAEVMKTRTPDEIREVEAYIRKSPPRYLDKLRELVP